MTTEHQILTKARELLTPPEAWTQGTLFRDKHGEACLRKEATCFCMLGAIHVASDDFPASGYSDAHLALSRALSGKVISCFNDAKGRKHSEVLAVFDKAIEYISSDNIESNGK